MLDPLNWLAGDRSRTSQCGGGRCVAKAVRDSRSTMSPGAGVGGEQLEGVALEIFANTYPEKCPLLGGASGEHLSESGWQRAAGKKSGEESGHRDWS